ncbi:MAG: hypothetical protein JXR20_05390 [Balneola sp.]
MRKLIALLFISVLFIGCGTSLKTRWGNFTAYYNTYYNAKKSYNSGLDKVLNAEASYNPQQPIRIHEVPVNAGAQDFDKAIEKGAEILRKHEDSKWVDNSLSLIGKSYFFKQEYFSADQKFQELALSTKDESLIEESILWRSRVLLEMELYGQGVQYIIQELDNREGLWTVRNKAELRSILAQYYVDQENWVGAIVELNEALPQLVSKKYQERGYFLLGQLHEKTENYRQAFKAYERVADFYHEYELQYLALRRLAETSRILGDNRSALETFTKMVKDDKNRDYKTELDYEIGRTYQEQKDFVRAEGVYKDILKDRFNQPSVETKALVYNGLAEVYHFGYNNFEMAAAYYDTSSRQNAPIQNLPENYNANELAVSFGEYSTLKNELQFRDSLLWVSNLSQPKLDSLVAKIKRERLTEIESEKRSQEQEENTLVNVSSPSNTATAESGNGFLNVNSETMRANARIQFVAVWGNRPLVDNWRIQEAIRSSGPSGQAVSSNTESNVDQESITTIETSIDLSEVPFTLEQKRDARKEIASLKYELGNLFFISLDMPDSAEIYFKDIAQNYPESDELPVSYYSLSEVQNVLGKENDAIKNAEILINRFPNSRYAQMLADKYGLERKGEVIEEELSLPILYQNLKQETSLTKSEFAKKSSQLALDNVNENESPSILFDAINIYIELAKEDSVYVANYEKWNSQKQNWQNSQVAFKMAQDSAKIAVNDTSLSELEIKDLQALVDSSLTQPNFNGTFPYYGVYWDSVRTNIDRFNANFQNSSLASRVIILESELEKPIEAETVISENRDIDRDNGSGVTSCSELESPLQIRGGLDAFLNGIENFESENEKIVYQFSINQRGVLEAFELVSSDHAEKIVEAYNSAIENSLTFNPYLVNGEAVLVTCQFSFPIK